MGEKGGAIGGREMRRGKGNSVRVTMMEGKNRRMREGGRQWKDKYKNEKRINKRK